jgi:hypothetical protein
MLPEQETNADGIRKFVTADGIPEHWPRRLKRACQMERWDLAVRLEADHMDRFVRWSFSEGLTRARARTTLPDIEEVLRVWRREPTDEDVPF